MKHFKDGITLQDDGGYIEKEMSWAAGIEFYCKRIFKLTKQWKVYKEMASMLKNEKASID